MTRTAALLLFSFLCRTHARICGGERCLTQAEIKRISLQDSNRRHHDKQQQIVMGGKAEEPQQGLGDIDGMVATNERALHHSSDYPDCPETKTWRLGDGYCDMDGEYNTKECGYDGGDCCINACTDGETFMCGTNGYDCKL